MIAEIIAFKKIAEELDELITNSPFKKNYIIEQVGLSVPTFYRKLKTKTFTADEMMSIAKIISPEEYYRMELMSELEEARNDYKNGETIPHSEMIERIKNKKK